MPILVRPNLELCREFMSRPTAHLCEFPTGWDFFFSLPIDPEWLYLMTPRELEFFHSFLSSKRAGIAQQHGKAAVDNVLAIQGTILDRLDEALTLKQSLKHMWENKHGIPVFDDDSQRLVDFIIDWDIMEFEGIVSAGRNTATMSAEKSDLDLYGPIPDHPGDFNGDPIQVLSWEKNGHRAYLIKSNDGSELFFIYGGLFEDHAQWMAYKSTLTDFERYLLHVGTLRITTLPNGRWELAENRTLGRWTDMSNGQVTR